MKEKQNWTNMRVQHNRLELFIGFVVLSVAFYFVYISYGSSHKSFQESYKLFAVFDRIDGLNVGSDVKISGVKVGYVTNYFVDPKTYQAKVEFHVQKTLGIPVDSTAIISSESLLGGKYLSLSIGADDKKFKQGDTIHDTQSSLYIENLLGKYLFSDDKNKN